jgi:hypothetical protein
MRRLRDVTFHLVEDTWGLHVGPPIHEINFSEPVVLETDPISSSAFNLIKVVEDFIGENPDTLKTFLNRFDIPDFPHLQDLMARRNLKRVLEQDPIIRIQNSTSQAAFVTSPEIVLQGLIACGLIKASYEGADLPPTINNMNSTGEMLGFVVPGRSQAFGVEEIQIILSVKPPRIVQHPIEIYWIQQDEDNRIVETDLRGKAGSDPKVTARP